MHSTEIGGSVVPAFITKLWKLVEDPDCSDLIRWSQSGLSFIIHDQSKFAKDLLPLYFKHNNMASFIRQLNMYGFRKVLNIEQGRLRGGEQDEIEFFHQFFVKGRSDLLEFIKRKVPSNRTAVSSPTSTINGVKENREEGINLPTDSVQEILSTMSNLKTKQGDVDSRLNSLKQENESLWREVAYLRQKHLKQQQIVNKLIHFLVTLVQPNRNIGMKRKLPLMLEDGTSIPIHGGKVPRLNRHYSKRNVSLGSPGGPVIHDVTDVLNGSPQPDPGTTLDDDDEEEADSPGFQISTVDTPPEVFIASPLGTEEHMEPLFNLDPLQNIDPLSPDTMLQDSESNTLKSETQQAAEPIAMQEKVLDTAVALNENNPKEGSSEKCDAARRGSDMQVALSDNSYISRNKLTDYLDNVDSELAWLQDQLSNGTTLNLDTSALLGLFSSDDTIPGSTIQTEPISFTGGEITGNEIMQYVPSLLDFEDELSADSPIASTSNLDTLLQTPDVHIDHPFDNFVKEQR